MVDARVLKAVAHPTRAEILRALERRDLTPMQLARLLGGSSGAVMHHVTALARLGVIELVEVRHRGGAASEHVYRVRSRGWGAALDRLERLAPPE